MLFSGGSISTSTTWEMLKVGAGGQLTGIDIALDGTKVVKADVANAYILPAGESVWERLITLDNWGDIANIGYVTGVWEVALAPNDSSRVYIAFEGYVFRKDDSGSWVQTDFTRTTGYVFNSGGATDSNGPNKMTNQKIIVDPVNKDVVYVATNSNGIERSIDGGVIAATVSDITASTTGPGGAGLCFDTWYSPATTVVSSQTRTTRIIAPSYGNGVWESVNGGVSFTQIADGSGGLSPVNVVRAKIGPDGSYICYDNAKVWRYFSGAWTVLLTIAACGAIVVEPVLRSVNPYRLIFADLGSGGKSGQETLDYTAVPIVMVGPDTWSPSYPTDPGGSGNRLNYATDIPWLANSDVSYMTVGDMKIDPTIPVINITGTTTNTSTTVSSLSSTTGLVVGQFVMGTNIVGEATIISIDSGASSMVISTAATASGSGIAITANFANIFFAEGIGAWKGNWPINFKGFNWYSVSAGIEELVSEDLIAPVGAPPMVAVEDRSVFVLSNLSVYPSRYYPTDGAFSAGWSLDEASDDPAFIAALVNWQGTNKSCYSTNSGTSWSLFAANPSPQNTGGNIAAASALEIVWVVADNGRPWYTLDGGATWTLCADLPNNSGYINSKYDRATIVAADRVNIGTFYLHNKTDHKIWKSTNGGQNWTAVYAGSPILLGTNYLSRIRCMPGGNAAGDVWLGGDWNAGVYGRLLHSIDGGVTWETLSAITELADFGFGKAATGSAYPVALYLIGKFNGVAGVWRSDDLGVTATDLGAPTNNPGGRRICNGDMNTYGVCFVGFGSSGFARGSLT